MQGLGSLGQPCKHASCLRRPCAFRISWACHSLTYIAATAGEAEALQKMSRRDDIMIRDCPTQLSASIGSLFDARVHYPFISAFGFPRLSQLEMCFPSARKLLDRRRVGQNSCSYKLPLDGVGFVICRVLPSPHDSLLGQRGWLTMVEVVALWMADEPCCILNAERAIQCFELKNPKNDAPNQTEPLLCSPFRPEDTCKA